MIKKYFLCAMMIIIMLSYQKSIAQTSPKIDEIEFTYTNSRRIPYNEVKINISRMSTSNRAIIFIESRPGDYDPQWNYSKIKKSITIDLKTFNKLVIQAVSLDRINIGKAFLDGKDGSTWEIKFGSKGKNKSYRFWSPNYNIKERGLSNFVTLCEKIIDISELKKEEILEN
ncbi:hypothetical protein [Flavobacterium sp. MDT1-60]|uniref:hypothetical protein n=1 Tax=Flavobacterium sp. MDT1-60 TaxID=1979344 RepID=UPI00177E9CE5|nr:hypothetical protein [Flavobacterium sp. MDT1-60]QOG03279.1 hypothetical protein IHE43_03285 [Flavobacterium sp. MDT1-60]